ncbi:MAG: endolytic transglycosylase MltG [Clostridiaceae bacterium]
MSKKVKFGILLSFILLIVITAASIAILYNSTIKKPFNLSENTIYTIKENETLYSVIDDLNSKRIIKNKLFLKAYIKINHINSNIVTGDYDISNETSFDQFIKNIASGQQSTSVAKVTIPEGYSIDEIAEVLEKNNVITKSNFIDAVKNYKLPSYVKVSKEKRYSLEGYLFPDTYRFKKDISGKEIIDTMIGRFNEILSEIETENNTKISKDKLEEIVNIASMVEKEAQVNEERDLISSVIYNRLKINMYLRIDATVLYAIGRHKDIVTLNDVKIASPYNTYYDEGLPVGPISNPGKNSIVAALNPKSTNYLFYFSKNDGTHFFTSDENVFESEKKKYGY